MATMSTLQHLPKPGYASGLSGKAMCGRYAKYGTGDHDMLLRLARAAVNAGDADHYCPGCLAQLRRLGQ